MPVFLEIREKGEIEDRGLVITAEMLFKDFLQLSLFSPFAPLFVVLFFVGLVRDFVMQESYTSCTNQIDKTECKPT